MLSRIDQTTFRGFLQNGGLSMGLEKLLEPGFQLRIPTTSLIPSFHSQLFFLHVVKKTGGGGDFGVETGNEATYYPSHTSLL